MQTRAESVAGNVRAEMARLRVSQSEMGAALGLTQQAVSRRLKGEVPFNVNELGVVADVLAVEVADLLSPASARVRSAS